MAKILTKGITLSYSADGSTWKELKDLYQVPELGGTRESVEVTTLDDDAHMYINGLISYGDSVDFSFMYIKEQFQELAALTEGQHWKVSLPDDTTVSFEGEPNVKLDSMGTNAPLTYTLEIKPTTKMIFA